MIETVCKTCLFCDVRSDKTYSCCIKKVPFRNDFCSYWNDKDEEFYQVGGKVTDIEIKRQVVIFTRFAKEKLMKTHDEEKQKRMTNKEYLIAVLTDDPRVDGCDYQSEVYYHINCPYYYGNKRAKCYKKHYDEITRNMCEECKCEWLEQEVAE